MSFIHPLIADASYSLAEGAVFIGDIITPVEAFFCEHFNIDWKINTIITTSLPWLTIPEDGVGGKTYASDFIILAVAQKSTTAARASEMLAHELAHAMRWGKNPEWSKNLFCELVNEGLAVHIEAKFAETQAKRTFFLETILGRSNDENQELFEKLKPHFMSGEYNYNEIFFESSELSRWAGYSVGYYVVKRYLEETGKSIFDAIGDPYEDFENYVIQKYAIINKI